MAPEGLLGTSKLRRERHGQIVGRNCRAVPIPRQIVDWASVSSPAARQPRTVARVEPHVDRCDRARRRATEQIDLETLQAARRRHRSIDRTSPGLAVRDTDGYGLPVAFDVQVVDVDAFLGEQRRELAQRFLRKPWLELDLRRTWWWFRAAPAHVGHAAILAALMTGLTQAPTPRAR